jgi:hypothetical protein
MANDQYLDAIFPIYGIVLSMEYELQPPDTTSQALNVRGFEALTLRLRGGSRCGLSKYIPQSVPGPFQDLNILVDPTEAALLGNFAYPSGTSYVSDPNTGYLIPVGGSGAYPFNGGPFGPPPPPPPPPPPGPPPPATNFWSGIVVSGTGPTYEFNPTGGGLGQNAQQLLGGVQQPTQPTPQGAFGVFINGTYYMSLPFWLGE